MLTPFYFLKAGSLVDAKAVVAGAGLIAVFLALKMATKFVGIQPLTRFFNFGRLEGMYTTLLMSTGLTFGTICARACRGPSRETRRGKKPAPKRGTNCSRATLPAPLKSAAARAAITSSSESM